MDAILLVGGQGTRLRPLTLTTPKPMLPTAGVPFVVHQLAFARAAGVDHVVLSTSYRAEVFRDALGDGSAIGVELEYVTEDVPLGTGGGIRNVADRLRGGPQDPVVVLNGDVLTGHDLRAQLAVHRDSAAAVTLHLVEVDDPRAFGCVPTDSDGRVKAFLEKTPDPVTNQVNAGCYVFTREVVDRIPAGRPVSVERETFPELLAAGARVTGFVDTSYWRDIGTPAAYVAASADLVTGRAPSAAVTGHGPGLRLPGCEVAPDAVVDGGSVVGADARVGAGCEIHAGLLHNAVVLHPDARITRSVLGRGAEVGQGTVVEDCVLADGVRIGAGNELRHGLRLWPGTVVPDGALRFSPDV